jgi:hypothetical protein
MSLTMNDIANQYIDALEKEIREASMLKYGFELKPKEIAMSKAPGVGNFYFRKENGDCFFFEKEIEVSDKGLELVACAVNLEL